MIPKEEEEIPPLLFVQRNCYYPFNYKDRYEIVPNIVFHNFTNLQM